MTLGDRVLDWLLRRHQKQKPLEADLVLVRAHPSIADTPPSFLFRGEEAWHFASVRGELTLRHALLRGGRLVAAVPEGMTIPLDLSERAYLRRPLTVEAHDIVAGLANTYCVRIEDAALARVILEGSERLSQHSAAWTLSGSVVTEEEVQQAIVASELGFDRKLERLPPAALLARWIVEGPPSPRMPALLERILRKAHGRDGEWLAWAIQEGNLDRLLTAGALAGSQRGRAAAPEVPRMDDDRAWAALRALVEDATRKAWEMSPSAVSARLSEAEGLARRLGLGGKDAEHHPLLRTLLEAALFEYAHAAAAGTPPTKEQLDPLERNLYGEQHHDARKLVEELSRLSRFCQQAAQVKPASIGEWARFARDHSAWADLSARTARRLGEHPAPDLVAPRRRVLERYLEVRDELNRRFAESLAAQEAEAYRTAALPEVLPLHTVTRSLICPLVEAGCRVLLAVLDGCDIGTFYELLTTPPDGFRVGLCLPEVNGRLAGDLERATALHVGLAPLPTVTSHARRALFAGEIPQNPALDEVEATAASARADHDAWSRNAALRDVSHRLFLKPDLGPEGANVLAAIESGDDKVVAVVFNAVDDALSSHETTAMGPWTYASMGSVLRNAIESAARQGMTIVVTSDHGHTPFWSMDRKAGPKGPQRCAEEPLPGAVAFGGGGLRKTPLYLLTAVGAYAGTQARGFHGGASLEEVVVPIALLGPVSHPMDAQPARPVWWTGEVEELPPGQAPGPKQASVPPASRMAAPVVVSSKVSPAIEEALRDQPRSLRVLETIAVKGVISATKLAELVGMKSMFVRGLAGDIQATLQRKRLEVPFTAEDQQDNEVVYRWKIRS